MACSKPVPGRRLTLFVEQWKKAGADPSLLHLVQYGHKIKFEDGIPALTKPSAEFETKLDSNAMNVVRKEVAALLEKSFKK